MRKIKQYNRIHIILTIFLLVQILGLQILKRFPAFVERYYSLGLYPLLSKTFRYLLGWIPFSVGDIFYFGIGLMSVIWIIKNVKNLRKNPISLLLNLTATVSVIYFMFHILWGLNYYRLPLHESLKMGKNYTFEELKQTTIEYIELSNRLHNQLSNNPEAIIPVPYSQEKFYALTSVGYEKLQKELKNLNYKPRSIKTSMWSTLLTYMGYSGYLNPFTGEAQVNGLIYFYQFPVVACHEEAHQIGFAAENEANFIAVMAALKNDDPYFRYAGSIFALRYLLGEMNRQNREEFLALRETVAPGIMESFKESDAFWDAYDNPFDKFFLAFFDNFLKVSNQSAGIQSYNYVVALLVNYGMPEIQ